MDAATLHGVVLGFTALACGAGQLMDCQTTDVALAHGYTEANPISAAIYKKIGAGGFFALKCMAIPSIGVALFDLVSQTYSFGIAMAWLVPFVIMGFYAGIKNYLPLKKAGIKVF